MIPLITLVGGWFGNAWRFRRERLDKVAEFQQKSRELDEERRRLLTQEKGRREQSDRELIEKAAVLCRSPDPQDRQHGLGFLVGLAAMGITDPRVVELLDQVTQIELGQTVADIRHAKEQGASTIEIVEEVVVSDSLRDAGGDSEGGQRDGGSVEAREAGADPHDQGDSEAGRDGTSAGDR